MRVVKALKAAVGSAALLGGMALPAVASMAASAPVPQASAPAYFYHT
jgi:hypothetical protein